VKVSLISLNLSGMQFLDAFLDSVRIELESFPDAELILLDNGSSDNSVSFVMNEHPWVRLIKSPRNLGFAAGCHKAADESKAEFLVFVNNDMELEPGFIDEILKPFLDAKDVGAVSGLILNDTGTQIDFAGGDANLFGWGFQRHHGEPASVIDEIQTGESVSDRLEVYATSQFFGCGGALAIKREIWEKSGGFDNDYFAFFEDVDLGWRLNLIGLKIVLASKARVKHRHHGTAVEMPDSLRTYLVERNALYSVIKNYDDNNLARIFPWALAMANERALIDQSIEVQDLFRGRWYEDIWGTEHSKEIDIISEIKDMKHAGISRAKKIIKRSQERSKHNVRLLAIDEVFRRWDSLMQKRSNIQNIRQVPDSEVIQLMVEPYRTVLGHYREKELMEQFSKNVHI